MDAAPQLLSVDEFLALEQASQVKHEYVGGIVYAMAGGSYTHNLIGSNFLVALGPRLRGTPCKALNSDTRIRVRAAHHVRFYYPDASIICGSSGETYQDEPRVLAEVLSPSTRRVDETEKKDAYFTTPGSRPTSWSSRMGLKSSSFGARSRALHARSTADSTL